MDSLTVSTSIGFALLLLVVGYSLWDARREEQRETATLLLLGNGDMTARELVGLSPMPPPLTRQILARLEQQGLVISLFDSLARDERYCLTHAGRVEAIARARLA